MRIICNLLFLLSGSFIVSEAQRCFIRRPPRYGRIQCTQVNGRSTVCSFSCNPGFQMRGFKQVRCSERGYWNNPFPVCLPRVHCNPPARPANGEVVCSHLMRAGSVCSYRCHDGFHLKGSASSTCGSNQQWSSSPPVCEHLQPSCQVIPQSPAFGGIFCLGRSIGSVCHYGCKHGYVLQGQANSTCVERETGAEWTTSPTCTRTCGATPTAPENGFMSCNGTIMGSRCYFGCHDDYILTGRAITSCIGTGGQADWQPKPTCQLMSRSCKEIPIAPENGDIHCDGTTLGSHCYFACEHGYKLMGMAKSNCIRSKQGIEWTPSPTCELARSQKSADSDSCQRADVLLLLDSSRYLGETNWAAVKEYVREFINSFSADEGMTRIGVFRYSSRVDTQSEIHLKDFIDDRDALLEAYDRINDTLNDGLLTGRALRHVKDVMLQPQNGDRANVRNLVFLFTAHSSDDDVIEPARQLRQETQDTTVYVIGIEPKEGNLDWRQHEKVAGSSQQFFNAGEGFDGLDEALSTHMEKIDIRLCREATI